MITYDAIRHNPEINTYITAADKTLAVLDYTEHSFAHVTKVANDAAYVLETLGYDEHEVELAKIAAYLHDIGNLVNRKEHAQSGAIMAFRLLDHLDMNAADISTVVSAIGNHDEGTGHPVNAVSAALILADKSDVRRSRVRNTRKSAFDIHDRVNYSVQSSSLRISEDKRIITLNLSIDTAYGNVMEYFEIFLERMVLCRKAAQHLGLKFSLVINDHQLL
ncbi:MAG: HD domain-containing protein [Clostridia bacterium]|nr:HD domain-containing protein [Clostridia bacterium]